MQQKSKAHLALLLTNIFFAINYSAVKYLVNEGLVQPFGLNLLRVGICTALLWMLYFFKKEKTVVRKKDIPRFILCGLTGIAINQMLFLKGLSLTYPIHASLLMLTTPILITIFAAWVLKERLGFFKISGLLMGVSGAVILITARDITNDGGQVLTGDILILINAVSYTIYFILVKPLMNNYKPITVIRMIFTIGLFFILPFCWSEFTSIPWEKYDSTAYLLLAAIVFGGTFLAYIFNVYGIKILGASIAGMYIYSQPVFAAAIAMIFLGEALTLYKIISAVCIFSGVYLANKTKTYATD